MFDYREYFIAIAAIFLALALGILIGVSFGDNFLVSNQRDIIELLEQELAQRNRLIAEKNRDLDHWEQIKPLIWRSYQNTLPGYLITVVAGDENAAAAILELLKSTGAEVEIAPAEDIMALSAAENNGASGVFEGPRATDCYILLMEGLPGEGDALYELWLLLRQQEKRVIAAFPWSGEEAPVIPSGERPCTMVDNIDTFWGKVSLLEMTVYGLRGDYGFGRDRQGLIPLQVENP